MDARKEVRATDKRLREIEREGTRRLNFEVRMYIERLSHSQLRKIYNYRLANAETRRMVKAEAKKRGYKLSAFGG